MSAETISERYPYGIHNFFFYAVEPVWLRDFEQLPSTEQDTLFSHYVEKLGHPNPEILGQALGRVARIHYLNTKPTTAKRIDELAKTTLKSLGYNKQIQIDLLTNGFQEQRYWGGNFDSWDSNINRFRNTADFYKYHRGSSEYFRREPRDFGESKPDPHFFAKMLASGRSAEAIRNLPKDFVGTEGLYFRNPAGNHAEVFVLGEEVTHMMAEPNAAEPLIALYEEGLFPLGVTDKKFHIVVPPGKPIFTSDLVA